MNLQLACIFHQLVQKAKINIFCLFAICLLLEQIVLLITIIDWSTSLIGRHERIQRGGGPPEKSPQKSQNIGFPGNIDPLKITKLPSQHLMAFRWRADDGPLLVTFRSNMYPHPIN